MRASARVRSARWPMATRRPVQARAPALAPRRCRRPWRWLRRSPDRASSGQEMRPVCISTRIAKSDAARSASAPAISRGRETRSARRPAGIANRRNGSVNAVCSRPASPSPAPSTITATIGAATRPICSADCAARLDHARRRKSRGRRRMSEFMCVVPRVKHRLHPGRAIICVAIRFLLSDRFVHGRSGTMPHAQRPDRLEAGSEGRSEIGPPFITDQRKARKCIAGSRDQGPATRSRARCHGQRDWRARRRHRLRSKCHHRRCGLPT